jgi:hypothetical protein
MAVIQKPCCLSKVFGYAGVSGIPRVVVFFFYVHGKLCMGTLLPRSPEFATFTGQ